MAVPVRLVARCCWAAWPGKLLPGWLHRGWIGLPRSHLPFPRHVQMVPARDATPVAPGLGLAAGVVLYVMVAGCLPFDEDDLVALFGKISKAEYEVPPWLSKDAVHLLGCMLNPDPDARCRRLWMAAPWLCVFGRLGDGVCCMLAILECSGARCADAVDGIMLAGAG